MDLFVMLNSAKNMFLLLIEVLFGTKVFVVMAFLTWLN